MWHFVLLKVPDFNLVVHDGKKTNKWIPNSFKWSNYFLFWCVNFVFILKHSKQTAFATVSLRSIDCEIPQTFYKQLGTSAFSPARCLMAIYPFLSVHSLIDKSHKTPSFPIQMSKGILLVRTVDRVEDIYEVCHRGFPLWRNCYQKRAQVIMKTHQLKP